MFREHEAPLTTTGSFIDHIPCGYRRYKVHNMMEELDAAAEAARMAESDTGLADPGEWHPTHKSEPGEPLARSGGSRNDEDDDLERDEDDIDDDDDGFERET